MKNKEMKNNMNETKPSKKPFEEFEGSDKSKAVGQNDHAYAPDVYLILKEYEMPSVLVEFEEKLEQIVLEFIQKGNPDEYNTSFLDARLRMLEAEALASLALQRNEHINGQFMVITDTHRQGKVDYKVWRANLERELKELEAEIAAYRGAIFRGTPLEEVYKNNINYNNTKGGTN